MVEPGASSLTLDTPYWTVKCGYTSSLSTSVVKHINPSRLRSIRVVLAPEDLAAPPSHHLAVHSLNLQVGSMASMISSYLFQKHAQNHRITTVELGRKYAVGRDPADFHLRSRPVASSIIKADQRAPTWLAFADPAGTSCASTFQYAPVQSINLISGLRSCSFRKSAMAARQESQPL